jgi:hypothetical protein
MKFRPSQPFSRQFHHPAFTPEQAFAQEGKTFKHRQARRNALSGLFSAVSGIGENLITWITGPFSAKQARQLALKSQFPKHF